MAGENTQININRARTDRFQLLLSDIPSSQLLFPDGADEMSNRMMQYNDKEYFALSLQSVEVPGLTLDGAKINTMFVPVAEKDMTLTYDSFTTEVRMDKRYRIYHLMVLWMMMIKNPEGFNQFAMKDTHDRTAVQATVIVKDPMTDGNLFQIDLFDVIPQSIPTLTLNYTTEDEVTFPITWHYSYWMPRTASGQPISLLINPNYNPV
jgi:hypothetical protein